VYTNWQLAEEILLLSNNTTEPVPQSPQLLQYFGLMLSLLLQYSRGYRGTTVVPIPMQPSNLNP